MLVTMVTHQWCNKLFYNELQIFNIRITYIFPTSIVYAVKTKLDVGHVYADTNNIIYFYTYLGHYFPLQPIYTI